MAKATYLHPEIVDGKANGRFRFVQIESDGLALASVPAHRSRGGEGLAVAFLASAMLWAIIALLVF